MFLKLNPQEEQRDLLFIQLLKEQIRVSQLFHSHHVYRPRAKNLNICPLSYLFILFPRGSDTLSPKIKDKHSLKSAIKSDVNLFMQLAIGICIWEILG